MYNPIPNNSMTNCTLLVKWFLWWAVKLYSFKSDTRSLLYANCLHFYLRDSQCNVFIVVLHFTCISNSEITGKYNSFLLCGYNQCKVTHAFLDFISKSYTILPYMLIKYKYIIPFFCVGITKAKSAMHLLIISKSYTILPYMLYNNNSYPIDCAYSDMYMPMCPPKRKKSISHVTWSNIYLRADFGYTNPWNLMPDRQHTCPIHHWSLGYEYTKCCRIWIIESPQPYYLDQAPRCEWNNAYHYTTGKPCK
jgi:hypothetical protein